MRTFTEEALTFWFFEFCDFCNENSYWSFYGVVDWTAVATNAVLDSENAEATSGAGSDEVENVIIDTDDADQAASGAGSDDVENVIIDTDGAEKSAGHGAESDGNTSIGSGYDSDDDSGQNKARRSTAGEEPETSPLSVSDDSDGAESV
jgi:hypothetical protein